MQTAKNRSLIIFFVLLLVLSVPLWIAGSMCEVQIFPGFNLYQLPLTMPMVTALILVYRESGRAGIIALLKRTYDFQLIKANVWFIPIFLIYPSMGFVAYLILRYTGIFIPAPQLSWAIVIFSIAIFFMTYGEELGWTGYAKDRMQQRWSAFKSGLVLGLAWAGIHVPILYINGYAYEWIFWHALYTVAGRVLFVWVYNNAGKSLFAMALMHSTFGWFWSLWPVENMHRIVAFYDPRHMALIAICYAVAVTLLWGGKTFTDYRYARNSHIN